MILLCLHYQISSYNQIIRFFATILISSAFGAEIRFLWSESSVFFYFYGVLIFADEEFWLNMCRGKKREKKNCFFFLTHSGIETNNPCGRLGVTISHLVHLWKHFYLFSSY